jgi:hypothetical protein
MVKYAVNMNMSIATENYTLITKDAVVRPVSSMKARRGLTVV